MSIIIYIAVMAGVTYLIRMIPFTLFRKKIKSTFFRGFLYYIPYAVLSAMTIPAIFYSTGNVTTSVIGTVVAVALAYFKLPLIVVALAASAAAFVLHELNTYISIDVFGETTNGTYTTAYGQYWPAISNEADVISGMPYPDHFAAYSYGLPKPWNEPYKLIDI